jgi:hypothetical protein
MDLMVLKIRATDRTYIAGTSTKIVTLTGINGTRLNIQHHAFSPAFAHPSTRRCLRVYPDRTTLLTMLEFKLEKVRL